MEPFLGLLRQVVQHLHRVLFISPRAGSSGRGARRRGSRPAPAQDGSRPSTTTTAARPWCPARAERDEAERSPWAGVAADDRAGGAKPLIDWTSSIAGLEVGGSGSCRCWRRQGRCTRQGGGAILILRHHAPREGERVRMFQQRGSRGRCGRRRREQARLRGYRSLLSLVILYGQCRTHHFRMTAPPRPPGISGNTPSLAWHLVVRLLLVHLGA